MKLYLYNKENKKIISSIDGVVSYTGTQVNTENGKVYGPLAKWVELSSKEDCSECLRSAWAAGHPSQEERMEQLEELMAELIFGGNAI